MRNMSPKFSKLAKGGPELSEVGGVATLESADEVTVRTREVQGQQVYESYLHFSEI